MKKYVVSIILIVLTFMMSIINVNAATSNFELVDFKVQSKKSTVTVDDISLSGNTVTSDVTFNKLNDYVAFELTIKNTDDDEYKVISVEDNNTNSNIDITYMFDDNYIKKGETTKVTVKLKYVQELTNQEKIELNNLKININFMKSDGTTETISLNPTPDSTSNSIINPTTGISILKYIILAILSATGLIIIITKKNKKIGTALLILAAVVIPFSVMANEKYGINLKFENIEVIGKDTTNNYATLIDGDTFRGKVSYKSGIFRKATQEEYNLVKDSLTEDNIISTEDSPKIAYIWDTSDGTLYYSEAKTIYMNADSEYMFNRNSFTSIDLTGMDSSKVTSMKYLLAESDHLEELDISSFDTSNVTDMESMFHDLPYLKTIYVFDEWDTSNVEYADNMFYFTDTLSGEQATIQYFETFNYREDYRDIDYAHVDGGVSNPGYLTLKGHDKDFSLLARAFYDESPFSSSLNSLGQDTKYFRKATEEEYNSVKDELSDENIISETYSPIPAYMWADGDYTLYYSTASTIYTDVYSSHMFTSTQYESIDMSGLNTSKAIYMYNMFGGSEKLKEIIFGDFDTSNTTSMSGMFDYCYELEELDLSSFDTSKVTDMSNMFTYDGKLSTIYVSDTWSMDNVSESSNMFYETYNLVGEKLTMYDDNYTDGEYARVDGGTTNPGYLTLKGHTKDFAVILNGSDFNEKIKTLDTDGKDFRKATSAEYNLVKDSLTNDDIVSTDSPNVYMWETDDSILYYSNASKIYLNKYSYGMFASVELKTIDLSGFDTTMLYDTSYMFEDCSNLTTIYVSEEWNMNGISNAYNMFSGANNLVGGQGTPYHYAYSNSEYAHIDGGEYDPGYLTDIADKE